MHQQIWDLHIPFISKLNWLDIQNLKNISKKVPNWLNKAEISALSDR